MLGARSLMIMIAFLLACRSFRIRPRIGSREDRIGFKHALKLKAVRRLVALFGPPTDHCFRTVRFAVKDTIWMVSAESPDGVTLWHLSIGRSDAAVFRANGRPCIVPRRKGSLDTPICPKCRTGRCACLRKSLNHSLGGSVNKAFGSPSWITRIQS